METEAEQEKLYNQFAQAWSEVESLAERIRTMTGRPVEIRMTKRPGWGFYAPKNFAFARKRQQARCLRISTNEQWAIGAGVDRTCDGVSQKGWFPGGRRALWWDMPQNDIASEERLAGILAKVCEARHR